MGIYIDKTVVLIGIIIVLSYIAFKYWLCLGATIAYMVAKKIAPPDNFDRWCEWYLKKSLGLKADLPDSF